jgi:hypothetical protein
MYLVEVEYGEEEQNGGKYHVRPPLFRSEFLLEWESLSFPPSGLINDPFSLSHMVMLLTAGGLRILDFQNQLFKKNFGSLIFIEEFIYTNKKF